MRENSKILSFFFWVPKQYVSWGSKEVELVLERYISMGTQQKHISKILPGEFRDSFKPDMSNSLI